ncbi:conserved Plasmodium protein, unknown function [Plasmodium vivax]|uniref:Uncharacterized protein n=1 Tax=Plasmodium vivax TaxID=5855 RepID=A0A1G4GU85_PLAVI|nr:conserved Plasmodium protein, unknown function [Plasmodium vivax]
MSLNFSDDDEVYTQDGAKNGEGDDLNGGASEDPAGDAAEDYMGDAAEDYMGDAAEDYMGDAAEDPVEGERNEEEEKKKRKKSITFQLKNIFNDVALNKITSYIRKKRKREKRNSYTGEWNDSHGGDNQSSSGGEEGGSDDAMGEEEDELQKYVREEKNKIKQILPENDELWDIYMYLNLKKKKRKIDYNEKHYTEAIRKILQCVTSDYKAVVIAKLFENKVLKKYLILPDQSDFFKNSKIEHIGRNTSVPIIKRKNSLLVMKKKLVEVYVKGNCCSYTKDEELCHLYGGEKDGADLSDHNGGADHYNMGDPHRGEFNREQPNQRSNLEQAGRDTNFVIEKEKINLELAKLTDKYTRMVHKIKQHRRKNLKTSFNLFMQLINEVMSKLYFPVNNVLLMGENKTDLTDIYKTVRRKYNLHDVLSKVQSLSQKKEVYEHYRAYLIYKYKSTYSACDQLFKTHQMGENINIFNFKSFYNTEFGADEFSVVRAQEAEGVEEANEAHEAGGASGVGSSPHGDAAKSGQGAPGDSFAGDVYDVYDAEDFFQVNVAPEGKAGGAAGDAAGSAAAAGTAPVEETPLERAKRIAREKKQKLMESRVKII